jgi:hypothetical protein
LSPLPRDTGGKSWDPECWDLPELCAHYGIPLWKVGLAPAPTSAPMPASGNVFIKPGTIPGEGEPCPKCGTVRPNNTPGACRFYDEAWDAGKRVAVEMGPAPVAVADTGSRPEFSQPTIQAIYAMADMPTHLPPAPPGTRPCMADGGGVVCTREQGHKRIQGPAGDHAAHNLRGEMVKRWPAQSPVLSVGT